MKTENWKPRIAKTNQPQIQSNFDGVWFHWEFWSTLFQWFFKSLLYCFTGKWKWDRKIVTFSFSEANSYLKPFWVVTMLPGFVASRRKISTWPPFLQRLKQTGGAHFHQVYQNGFINFLLVFVVILVFSCSLSCLDKQLIIELLYNNCLSHLSRCII